MSQALVKFHGNALMVPHESPVYKIAQEELIKVTSELQKVSGGTWETTGASLKGLVQKISDPNSRIQQYQIDLIREVLVPYLKKQRDRYFTDQARVRQLNEIIFALSLHGKQHPAISLNMLEKVKTEIQSNQSYLWKSELLTALETSLAKQWLPIVADTKQFLIDTSGKLFVLGMIGLIGWPIAFFSPIMYSSKKLMKAMEDWDRRKTFSNDTVIELVKVALMIMLLMQLVTVLQFYAALGQLLLAGSMGSFLIAQSEGTVKELSPVLAPQAYLIDQFFFHLSQGDMKAAMRVVSTGPPIEDSLLRDGVKIEVLDDPPTATTTNTRQTNPTAVTSSSSSAHTATTTTTSSSFLSSASSVRVEVLDENEEEEKPNKARSTPEKTGSTAAKNSSTSPPPSTSSSATSSTSSSSSSGQKSIFDSEGLRKRRLIRGLI
jgi:hypothetical protein